MKAASGWRALPCRSTVGWGRGVGILLPPQQHGCPSHTFQSFPYESSVSLGEGAVDEMEHGLELARPFH